MFKLLLLLLIFGVNQSTGQDNWTAAVDEEHKKCLDWPFAGDWNLNLSQQIKSMGYKPTISPFPPPPGINVYRVEGMIIIV
jgi:hypothetical protein